MKKEPTEQNTKFNPLINLWIAIILSMSVFGIYNYITSTGQSQTLSYNDFKNRLEQNLIKEIWIDKDQVVASVKVNIG
ncbi:MAG: ATP-dependent metallopeptidase FtsH/Yme1/Tma family protein, partial [Campylobacterota bacterium]|nr:ATP-dependent metallopeptidase FtsH/Yme1/Tma family protein [Campylobacterota bacterium]